MWYCDNGRHVMHVYTGLSQSSCFRWLCVTARENPGACRGPTPWRATMEPDSGPGGSGQQQEEVRPAVCTGFSYPPPHLQLELKLNLNRGPVADGGAVGGLGGAGPGLASGSAGRPDGKRLPTAAAAAAAALDAAWPSQGQRPAISAGQPSTLRLVEKPANMHEPAASRACGTSGHALPELSAPPLRVGPGHVGGRGPPVQESWQRPQTHQLLPATGVAHLLAAGRRSHSGSTTACGAAGHCQPGVHPVLDVWGEGGRGGGVREVGGGGGRG